jgi:hypothetical protein
VEVVKVVDFGLSKVLGLHHANETAPGTILGTAEYVAPETTLGNRELIDFRADQWALGVMAYRMLSGRLPFEAPDVITLLLTIRQSRPRPLGELLHDLHEPVPEHIVKAVERAMAKNKEDRFASVQDFLRALDGLPPVGDLLSKSADGIPAASRSELSNRNMAAASLTDLGRISISGAMQSPSSTSGKLSASANSGRGELSSPSGRVSAKAKVTSLGLGPVMPVGPALDVPAGGSPSRRTPKYGLLNAAAAPTEKPEEPVEPKAPEPPPGSEVAGAFAPLSLSKKEGARVDDARKAPEPSAEYSAHLTGDLINAKAASLKPNIPQPLASRSGLKLVAPALAGAVVVFGLLWVFVPHRAPSPPPPSRQTLPQAVPAVAVPPGMTVPAAVAPAPAVAPGVAAPVAAGLAPPSAAGVAPAPASSPPLSPPPVQMPTQAPPQATAQATVQTPLPAAGPPEPSLAPPVPAPRPVGTAPAVPVGGKPARVYAGGASGWKPGPGVRSKRPGAAPHAAAQAAPANPAAAGAAAAAAASAPPPQPAPAAPPPAPPPPKDGDPPKRITVVD